MNTITFNARGNAVELTSVVGHKTNNVVVQAIHTLSVWNQRARQRRHLNRLDHRLLKDIGITYADVDREMHKPFWKS